MEKIEKAIEQFNSIKLQYDITKSIDDNISDLSVNYTNCFANINPPIL